ncbi:hypothetical protein MMC07_006275 [Pseudocyphellaria aurata]|nr:hypothetical protein [Pseudocyphellaria aurata]
MAPARLPLPNQEVIETHFQGIADQFALPGNVPAVNNATVLQEIMRTLTTIQTGMVAMERRMDTRMDAMEARIDAKLEALETRMDAKLAAMEARINTRFEAMENRISELETRMERRLDVLDCNTEAKIHNWGVKTPEQSLEKLKTSMNVFPDEFPETLGQLNSLPLARTDALLAAYGLPITGDIGSKRKSLRRFLGAVRVKLDYCQIEEDEREEDECE